MKAGLDPKLMIEVFNAGTGRNLATETKFAQAILTRRFAYGPDSDYTEIFRYLELTTNPGPRDPS